jgi:signal transduction histidine kinase/CheY-like chemotaxis protein
MQNMMRTLGNRGFSNAALESEFQVAYRSYGTRFLFVSSMVAAIYFLVFFGFDLLTGHRALGDQVQLGRLGLSIGLLLFGYSTRLNKAFFTRHYTESFVAIVSLVCLLSNMIITTGHWRDDPMSLLWGLTSATVFATVMVYGFARLTAGPTVMIGLFIGGMALAFAAQQPQAHGIGFQRMTVHVIAANALGYFLYRFSMARERKLFLQSKRKNHIAELRRMKEQAESASRAKTAFLANMSHEIRTPMNGVIGALSMLNDEHLSERDRLFVKSARDSARNLMHLLNEILDYSKLDAHKIRLTPAPFDPIALLSSVAHAFQATAEQKGIHIRRDCHHVPSDIRSLTGDEGKIRQVLLNLVSNAVKFTHCGEVLLSLSVRKSGTDLARVTLDVSDTGVGIPSDAIDNLFQPFYQVESGSNRSFGGTGLGLAICKQIVDEMGGDITVRSVLGIGTTFEVSVDLPYSTEALSEEELQQGANGFADTQPPAMAGVRLQGDVLLVEDNEVNAFIATMTLESLGVSCQHARNGADALTLFSMHAFDVVLMDCEMPVMDGHEAARRIRQLEAEDTARERTPVIALTAHALSGDREVCLANGMDDYLTKPFDREALAQLLSRWLPVATQASA